MRQQFSPLDHCRTLFKPESYESVEVDPSRLWKWNDHPFLPLTEADHCRFKVRSATVRFKEKHALDALREAMQMDKVRKRREIERMMTENAAFNRTIARVRSKVDKLQEHFDALLAELDRRMDYEEKVEYIRGLRQLLDEAYNTWITEIKPLEDELTELDNQRCNIQQFFIEAREYADHLNSRAVELERIHKRLMEEKSLVAKILHGSPGTFVTAIAVAIAVVAVTSFK